jgi:carboxypeptidase Taq
MPASYYQQLCSHFQSISHLQHLQAICGWDQAAIMPSGGNQARSEAMAELALLIHGKMNAPQLSDWFAGATEQPLAGDEQASLFEMHRSWQRATALPAELVKAQSLAGATCEHAWRSQRPANDWQGFAKNLKEVVRLAQEEAQIRSAITGLSAYDAMMDKFEPGMTTAKLDPLFADLQSWLPALITQVVEKQSGWPTLAPGHYEQSQQQALGLKIMQQLGFDFNHGRLDISTHPFCGGVPTDVRITTRYKTDDFTQSLMGIVHETGHARYEQGLPKAWAGLPVGQARSMGIHESQSLFFEMQLGCSLPFIEQLLPQVNAELCAANPLSLKALRTHYHRVQPGFIRVEADEVTYPAHIMLRYEIERGLVEGSITVDQIPDIWDQKMTELLGLSTQGNDQNGCMQDIHWTDGSFGYFPSYTLGAMYAAQFMATMKKTVDVDAAIRSGDMSPIFNWLKTNIWSQASLLPTDALVEKATGEHLNTAFFKQHLMTRYLS